MATTTTVTDGFSIVYIGDNSLRNTSLYISVVLKEDCTVAATNSIAIHNIVYSYYHCLQLGK